jgi:hypothetical protein
VALRSVLVLAMLLALGCAGRGPLQLAPGDPDGTHLASLVDSEPAHRLLVDLLTHRSFDRRLVAGVVSDQEGYPAASPAWLPDQAQLRKLSREVSVDFAALSFARVLGADERSRAVQDAFAESVQDGPARSEEILRRPDGFPYMVLFAPAWLYRSHPEVGADFARQRQLLDRLGIANRLIPTPESGSVEDNAAVIAATIKEAARDGRALIVVSTSKSGAEVALALSRLLRPEECASVVGWLNAGGALGGTPLADAALRPPAAWLTRSVLWFTGWSLAGLTSMTTAASRARLEGARLPESIAVVNVVAVPVSGSVGRRLYGSYKVLRRDGPNDGVVLLADAVWPGGANLVALGSDHLFTELQEDGPGLALLRALDTAIRLHHAQAAEGRAALSAR